MNKNRAKLQEITKVLLDDVVNYKELYDAIDAMSVLLTELAEIDMDVRENRDPIYVESGKAIGVTWAALCVKEIMRTKQFVRGIYKGILEAKRRFPGQRIHLLYAGTGPFATLVLPMFDLFEGSEIGFTFLEINKRSLIALQKVVQALEMEDYIIEIVQGDATTYEIDPQNPVHMIVTETMNRALGKEPQVAITKNLVTQMADNGILIPQNIVVQAALLNGKKNRERMLGEDVGRYYEVLEELMALNIETAGRGEEFPCIEARLPKEKIEEGFNQLVLLTHIQVYDDIELTNWQCSLTLPQQVRRYSVDDDYSEVVKFQYKISETPGFVTVVD